MIHRHSRVQDVSEMLGQTFIIDNRPRAANIIAIEMAAKAPLDIGNTPAEFSAQITRERERRARRGGVRGRGGSLAHGGTARSYAGHLY